MKPKLKEECHAQQIINLNEKKGFGFAEPPSLCLTSIEILLQVVHDLRRVADDVVVVDEDRHLTGGTEMHEPGLIVFTERQAHVILLAAQTFLCYGQAHLWKQQV